MPDYDLLGYQYEFLTSQAKEALLLGGVGCIHDSALIETKEGKFHPSEIKKPTEYLTFNGLNFEYRLGSVPFLKGKGDLYRVSSEQGEFVAYERHLVFCSDYKYRLLKDVFFDREKSTFSYGLHPTTSVRDLLTPFLGVQSSLKQSLGFLFDYLSGNRFYGVQPLLVPDNAQAFVPSIDGVLEFFQLFCQEVSEHRDDFWVRELAHNHPYHMCDRICIDDYLSLVVPPIRGVVDRILSIISEHTLPDSLLYQRSLLIDECHQIVFLLNQYHISRYSPSNPTNNILNISKCGKGEYWDLHIPGTNNYIANGAIHHNSGKTFTGSHFAINMASEYPKSKGLIIANTYTQLMNATVEAFTEELDNLNIRYRPVLSGAKKHIQIGPTKIYLYSLEKYDNIRGIETGWVWGDESLFCSKPEAFKVVRGRLRDKNGPLLIRHTSSPNGFNWGYDKFENKDGRKKTDKIHLIRAKTKENIFLPDGYYEDLLEDYGGIDNPLAMQELGGEFTNISAGGIYWGFSRDVNVHPCKADDRFPVYVGQDFNVNNMANCYVQYIDGTFFVFQENVLTHHGANTDSAAAKTVRDLKPKYRPIVIPDSTGKAIKTSASGRSDIEILESYGLEVANTRNPLIRDRQNTLNMHMKKCNLIIDPSCVELIKEIETISGRDKEGDKAHVSVGLGYVTWKIAPLRKTMKRSTYK